jgi:tRNA(adenine34) deaminase
VIEPTPGWAFDEVDRAAMSAAIAEARSAGAGGDVPIGAVVTDGDRRVIARAGNRRERDGDPTAHAEILALRAAAAAAGGWRLDRHTLYVTLEPCAMCAAACGLARLACVVFAVPDPKSGFAGSVGNLLDDPRLNHRVAWRAGLLADQVAAELAAFFAKLRMGR